MGVSTIIVLLIIGFGILLFDLLVTPGAMLSLISVVLFAIAIYLIYQTYGTPKANYFTAGIVVLTGILLIILLKSGVWQRMASKETLKGKARISYSDMLNVGDVGKTLSGLRPSGNALFSNVKVEVTTQGDSIAENQEIEIIAIKNNKIFVKQKI